MSSSAPNADPRAQSVETDDDEILVHLTDGRSVAVPLACFPKLLHAARAQRRNWELLGDGEGIHWPDLDEDLNGLLRGTPAPGVPSGPPRG